MLRALAVLAALTLSTAPARAAEPETTTAAPMTIAETVVLRSKILGEDRRLIIYRPGLGAAAEPSDEPAPVLYLLDAERQLPLVAGQIDYLSKFNLSMPRMVIVGVQTNGYDRMRDLTPTHSDRAFPGAPIDTGPGASTRTSGGGERFLAFLREEVRPYVEARHHPAPYRILAGHSLGGLLTVHALLAHPEDFDAYVAISPSLWWDDERLIDETPARLAPGRLKGKRLFVSIAGEGGRFGQDLDRFDRVLAAGAASGLTHAFKKYPDETHAGAPAVAYRDAWTALWPRWLSPETDRSAARTRAFYQALSRDYGYAIAPPEGLVNARGYQALGETPPRTNEAIAFFEMNTAAHPASANAFDSLGDGYAAAGRKAEAVTAYQRALELAPDAADTARKLAALKAAL